MAFIEVSSMRIRHFWSLIVLTGLAVASQPAAHGYKDRDSDSGPHLRSKVDFELYQNYLIVVHGSVGPLKGLNFLFDTGASPSVLDPRIASKLHLATMPADTAVLEGTIQTQTAIVPSFQLGPLQRQNLSVVIGDLSFIQNAFPFRLDGIVGLDVLGQTAFEIDYRSREIRFDLSPSSPDSIPFRMQRGLAIVDATINHTQVHLLLDTGSPSIILFQEMPASGSKPVLQRAKTIGNFDRKHVQSIDLKLGETDFGHEAAFVVSSHKDAGHDFDGVISPASLGITRVSLDPTQGKLTLTRNP
jgi:hypothetical protein